MLTLTIELASAAQALTIISMLEDNGIFPNGAQPAPASAPTPNTPNTPTATTPAPTTPPPTTPTTPTTPTPKLTPTPTPPMPSIVLDDEDGEWGDLREWDDNALASQKQIDYVVVLAKEAGWSGALFNTWLAADRTTGEGWGVNSLPEMTKTDISQLIDGFKKKLYGPPF